MYGLINKAIEDFVTQEFGAEIWERILEKADMDAEVFISMKVYPDDWTYRLIDAASETLALPADSILIAFGEHWIRFMHREGYGQLLTVSGRTFPAFLNGLDNMHAHIALTFNGSKMPSFVAPNSAQIDCRSIITPKDGV